VTDAAIELRCRDRGMRICYAHMTSPRRPSSKPRRVKRAPAAPARRAPPARRASPAGPTRRTRSTRKTPTNLSLRLDLVHRAKALRLNLSDVVERALETAIVDAEQARWLAENDEAIDQYNSFVEKHGLFGDEFRQF
jgi:antitoxin CcdA